MEKSIRIHVGGLGESVSRDDILKIFSPMGSVEAVDFVRTKGRSFAYIDFSPSSSSSLSKLFSTYNGCVWKGGRLRLEKAKEHYLARLRREWEEDATFSAACPSQNPPKPSAQNETQLQLFFPRLRKVKSLPFSGTGKHKYSFQHVQVPSLPKYFCDCDEHSVPHPSQQYGGIKDEEFNIMKSVMNRLFRGENHANSEQGNKIDLANSEEGNAGLNELDFEADEDNLVINAGYSGNKALPSRRNWGQETVSRKRKAVSSETRMSGGRSVTYDTKGLKRIKKRQLTSHDKGGGRESTLSQPENRELSEANSDKSLVGLSQPVSGVKRPMGSIYWSQKSSWKALAANADSSKFSVSSVLSGITYGKEEQPSSSNTDFMDMPMEESLGFQDSAVPSPTEGSTAKNVVNKQLSKSPTPMRKTGKLAVVDVNESNESSATDPEGRDKSKTLANKKIGTTIEAESTKPEGSIKSSAVDPLLHEGSGIVFDGDFGRNQVVSSLHGGRKDDDSGLENFSSAKNVKENVKDEQDIVDAGKGLLGASNGSTRGPSWLQRSSWTQLVSEKNGSFSVTQLFPDRKFEKEEGDVEHGDAERSNSKQGEREAKSSKSEGSEVGYGADEFTQDCPERSGLRAAEGQSMGLKKTIGGCRGLGETCTFMRNAFSLKEWANAKKALTGIREKRGNEK